MIFLAKAMKKEILLTGIVGSSCADLGVTKATVDTLVFFSYLREPVKNVLAEFVR